MKAAIIDGAVLVSDSVETDLPLSTPALITVAIFSFFYHWDELLMPLIDCSRRISSQWHWALPRSAASSFRTSR